VKAHHLGYLAAEARIAVFVGVVLLVWVLTLPSLIRWVGVLWRQAASALIDGIK